MRDEGAPFGAVDFVCATSGLGQKRPSLTNAQIVRIQTRGELDGAMPDITMIVPGPLISFLPDAISLQ